MATGDPAGLILSETKLERFRFGSRTPARAGVQIVVQGPNGSIQAVEGQRTLGEALFGPHATQYEIDVASHESTIDVQVKTREEAYAFRVVLRVRWFVGDAVEVARRRLANGEEAITSALRDRLGELGREYGVGQTLEFEQRIRTELTEPGARLLEDCLRVERVSPEVSLDAAGAAHLRTLRDEESRTDIIRTKHRNQVLEQHNADELATIKQRQQIERDMMTRNFDLQARRAEEEFEREQQIRQAERDELARRQELEWKAQFNRQEAEWKAQFEHNQREIEAERENTTQRGELEWKSGFDRQQAEWKARFDRDQADYEFAREQERGRLYLEAMKSGDAAVLAQYLGRNPDDAKELIHMIVNNQAVADERKARILAEMIEKNLIINADLDGVSQDLVRAVAGVMSRPVNGIFSLNTTVEVSVGELSDKKAAVVDDPEATGGDGVTAGSGDD